MRSRHVLHDARLAWALLENETDPARYRVYWVAAVALCRALGHVIDKVDRYSSAALLDAIDVAWKRWPNDRQSHRISWDFIDGERNRVLKRCEIGFLAGPIAVMAGDQSFAVDDLLSCPIEDGYGADEDCRGLLGEAISWRGIQLADIERASVAPW